MLNHIILIGRLTKDVEYRKTTSGKGVASFTLAVDRTFRNRDGEREADFLPIVVWGNTAENCAKYISKGSLVAVDGRVQTRSYEKDGRKVYITEIVANDVRFLDSKKGTSPDYGTPVDTDENIPF